MLTYLWYVGACAVSASKQRSRVRLSFEVDIYDYTNIYLRAGCLFMRFSPPCLEKHVDQSVYAQQWDVTV